MNYQSLDWQQQVIKQQIRCVLLVHGTFAGNDAFGLFELIEPIHAPLAARLKHSGKRFINRVTQDVGNYTPHYAEQLAQALAIDCQLFVWSSANFHLARLQGAINLAQLLAEKINQLKIQPEQRILLLGHSHAGQLFALLSHFLAEDALADQLYAIIASHSDLNANKKSLFQHLKSIRQIHLDFVTFGTPIRYSWAKYDKYRLLAIVNHRAEVSPSGLLSTRDGDYIQQWGIAGTDILPPLEKRVLNDQLDELLDKGRDLSIVIDSLKRGMRQHPCYDDGSLVSETLLIDYQDNAPFSIYLLNPFSIPHCIKTLFGHGVYTCIHKLGFTLNLIFQHLYRNSI